MATIDGWEDLAKRDILAGRAKVEADPRFPELVAEAAKRGYRRPTLSEHQFLGPEDLYTWRGLVWVKATRTN